MYVIKLINTLYTQSGDHIRLSKEDFGTQLEIWMVYIIGQSLVIHFRGDSYDEQYGA